MRLISTASAIVTLAVILTVTTARGQVTVILHDPPPTQLHVEMLWRVDLINVSGEARTVRLYGVATETSSGRWIAHGTSNVFTIPVGPSSVNPADISPIDYNADPEYDDIVTQTGRVPAGEYTICVSVIDDNNRQDTLGRDCITEHVVLNLLPPQLIYPADNSTISEQFPLFAWTPVLPSVLGIEVAYRVQVVELVGQQSAFDALESNPVWFEEEEIVTTVVPYPLSAQAFEPGTSYAWQVVAFGETLDGAHTELARSETGSFTVGSEMILTDDEIDFDPGDPLDFGPDGNDIVADEGDLDVVENDDDVIAVDGGDPDGSGTNGGMGDGVDGGETQDPLIVGDGTVPSMDYIPVLDVIYLDSTNQSASKETADTSARPPNMTYGTLRRTPDGGYYDAVGYLRFIYDNPYSPHQVHCRIHDEGSRDVTPREYTFDAVSGRNYYSIDLRKEQSLVPATYYTLMLRKPDGESLICRFVVHRCDGCPDEPDRNRAHVE